ncbi:MAG: leucyl aminopeptidase [Jiangellaceae bacterium]|nr:leucyl aminopeptidase [Jiangellaceae bacterium]
MTSIALSSARPTKISADAVVVGVTAADGGPRLLDGTASVDKALHGSLANTLRDLGATGKADEVTKVPMTGNTKAAIVVAVGLGKLAEHGTTAYREALRRAAGSAARALAGTRAAVFALPVSEPDDAAAITEGVLLGSYAFGQYKTGNGKPPLERATLVASRADGRRSTAALRRAEVLAEAVNQARHWVNTPPRDMTPAAFAAAAQQHARGLGMDVTVLDEAALRKGGYGGIVGVGQGSANPPRLVRLAYRPFRAKRHVALVGKGITFDSGGLSLKTADGMTTMKCDMGGAAAVVAAVVAVARLQPRVAVTAYAPMAENMPSGSAQRPSDVLTIRGGKTVEVLNTDAEGRLVLADAIARAGEDEPDLIVDIATLTGACRIALGTRTAGIMANDDRLRDQVHRAAERAGEPMWPLPLSPELREKLDSPVADIANVGAKWGGALSAGLFLAEFVADGIGWAHIDIAGPAFNEDSPFGYTPKGGTGAGVRTLVQIVEDVADGTLSAMPRP